MQEAMPEQIEEAIYSDDSLDQRSIPDEADDGDIEKLLMLNWP
jgi:hypothetical protein